MAWRNFAAKPINFIEMSGMAIYDPDTGWTQRPGYADGTISFGIKGVRLPEDWRGRPLLPLPKGPVLAVGSSWVVGSEVKDRESWPAQLEAKLGVPVVNGGIGGYSLDQAYLRAEKLAPLVNPRAILVDYQAGGGLDIIRMSIYSNVPKPYYEPTPTGLVLHNHPVPRERPTPPEPGFWRETIGYSYLAYWLADRLGFGSWWRQGQYVNIGAHEKPLEVACALFDKYRELGQRYQAPVMVVVIYGGNLLKNWGGTLRQNTEDVMACARQRGIEVVDTRSDFEAKLQQGTDVLNALYTRGGVGHYSPEGNRLVADRLAQRLSPLLAQPPR